MFEVLMTVVREALLKL